MARCSRGSRARLQLGKARRRWRPRGRGGLRSARDPRPSRSRGSNNHPGRRRRHKPVRRSARDRSNRPRRPRHRRHQVPRHRPPRRRVNRSLIMRLARVTHTVIASLHSRTPTTVDQASVECGPHCSRQWCCKPCWTSLEASSRTIRSGDSAGRAGSAVTKAPQVQGTTASGISKGDDKKPSGGASGGGE